MNPGTPHPPECFTQEALLLDPRVRASYERIRIQQELNGINQELDRYGRPRLEAAMDAILRGKIEVAYLDGVRHDLFGEVS